MSTKYLSLNYWRNIQVSGPLGRYEGPDCVLVTSPIVYIQNSPRGEPIKALHGVWNWNNNFSQVNNPMPMLSDDVFHTGKITSKKRSLWSSDERLCVDGKGMSAPWP